MYIISRMLYVQKACTEDVLKRLKTDSPVLSFDGFVRREIYIEKPRKETFDYIRFDIAFENKKAFYRWEGSPEHIAMHRDKHHGHGTKIEGIIKVESHHFNLHHSDKKSV